MIEYIKNFIKPEKLFDLQPMTGVGHVKVILMIALLIFVLSLVEWLLVKKLSKNKAFRKLSEKFLYFLIFLSLSLAILVFFRLENVYLFSSNIFILIVMVCFFVWLMLIIYYIIFKMRNEAKNFRRASEINKYIPKASQKW